MVAKPLIMIDSWALSPMGRGKYERGTEHGHHVLCTQAHGLRPREPLGWSDDLVWAESSLVQLPTDRHPALQGSRLRVTEVTPCHNEGNLCLFPA